MSGLTARDVAYWLAREEEIVPTLVDLAGYGFVVDHDCWRRGWTDDPRCLLRRGAAEALARAREALPAGCNFKVVDGWRPWGVQQACAEDAEGRIRASHPDWTEEAIQRQLWTMAPPQRIVPRFGSHRYGGAVDLTVVDTAGRALEMGVPLNYVEGPEAGLLFYELRDDLRGEDGVFRENRRLLIRALSAAGFEPYLPEYWHWGYARDLT